MVESMRMLGAVSMALLAVVSVLVVTWQGHSGYNRPLVLGEPQIDLDGAVQKYTGDGFTFPLQFALLDSLNKAEAYYRSNLSLQAQYIATELTKVYNINWEVIVIRNLDINETDKLMDVIGYKTYCLNGNVYAFWYGVCDYDPNQAYLVTGSASTTDKTPAYINTASTDTSNISKSMSDVIYSVNKAAQNNATAISAYTNIVGTLMNNFNNKNWYILTLPYLYNNLYPDAFARIRATNSSRASFEKAFQLKDKTPINQLLFYYN